MLLLQRKILRMILFANVAKRLCYFSDPPPFFGPVRVVTNGLTHSLRTLRNGFHEYLRFNTIGSRTFIITKIWQKLVSCLIT